MAFNTYSKEDTQSQTIRAEICFDDSDWIEDSATQGQDQDDDDKEHEAYERQKQQEQEWAEENRILGDLEQLFDHPDSLTRAWAKKKWREAVVEFKRCHEEGGATAA
ncbi:uncharacterized protein [Branchiostoma lanceolatum]|uniref:uncharacterized protein n=1 Tax=Branchiostoma lanceolatum TaxID=7740 RepID=UPI0034522D6C